MWSWSKRLVWVGLLLGLTAGDGRAQSKADWSRRVAELIPVPGIAENFVSNLAARGDSLWVGPRLDLTFDGGQTWYRADVDSITQGAAASMRCWWWATRSGPAWARATRPI
ncbi:hypothetical protein [Rhodothermus marinus]|uniref:hypothetical protein n=1 Tax=Rhodothermus marinus TaxID=29549 RepID=UPI001FB3B8EE|nr:hypothetical protein [Rhodothermus marinus]